MSYTILVAEDDIDIANLLELYLKSNDYNVIVARDGVEAYDLITKHEVDLAVLDIMMPNMDGYELTMKIRKDHNFPIIFLSAKNQDSDKILGLNMGADDYMTKPFNPLEIVARVKSNLRRYYELNDNKETDGSIYTIKDLTIDLEKMSAKKGDKEIILTPTEFKILALLMKHPGRIFTKAQICESTFGDYYDTDDNSMMVHISKLREKLGDNSKDPKYIRNIRGIGYKIDKE
ncbi:response regulator transcription factor [Aminicella lysinilytica]|uniref:Stage 0 sporulation protein A homolog n=1 Tax=Aminicella lysinilytica TaxID=433323 RepID=A0A4V3CRU8_9FIRM|nr:response regulator transcription factor [Aminicella lysinilytica]NLD10735.1 response regulator transcription factor [Clostridiales bacterium]TDP58092.1 DNA-binding response OmpR family regulator [Aminicella lysinilytica]